MRFTIVSPDGAEYGCDGLATYREKFKPRGYLIARDQPSYDDWGVPKGAADDELVPEPKAEKPATSRKPRAEKPAETTPDAA